jgi:hypothetical protein
VAGVDLVKQIQRMKKVRVPKVEQEVCVLAACWLSSTGERRVRKVSKKFNTYRAGGVALATVLVMTAWEGIKEIAFGNLAEWQSNGITIVLCGTAVFVLGVIFLRREERSTEKVRVALALSEALIDGLPGVVTIIDSAGRIRRWNQNFLGGTAAEMLGTEIMSTVAPESKDEAQRTMMGRSKKGQVKERRGWSRKAGKEFTVF